MNKEEKLEQIRLEIVALKEKGEKTLAIIGDALESTTTDLRAANYVIHLYGELTLDLGNIAKLLQKQVTLSREA